MLGIIRIIAKSKNNLEISCVLNFFKSLRKLVNHVWFSNKVYSIMNNEQSLVFFKVLRMGNRLRLFSSGPNFYIKSIIENAKSTSSHFWHMNCILNTHLISCIKHQITRNNCLLALNTRNYTILKKMATFWAFQGPVRVLNQF